MYRFRGILTILSPLWLSEVGAKRVEKEFNLRAHMRSIREGERPPPDMSLEELFHKAKGYIGRDDPTSDDKKLELKLKIQGFKNMPAIYMLCEFGSTNLRHYESMTNVRHSQGSSTWVVMDL